MKKLDTATGQSNSGQLKPEEQQVKRAIQMLDFDGDLRGARLIFATPVGSWAEGLWKQDDDVDIRAIYVLPTSAYLGIGSYRDEVELLEAVDELRLDLVAFELEKVIRLVLKGHEPTMRWLSKSTAPLIELDGCELLGKAARRRREGGGAISAKLFGELDRFLCRARLGEVARGPK